MPSTTSGRGDAPSKSMQIRALLSTGLRPKEIAERVGCTPTLVSVVKWGMKKAGKGQPRAASKSSRIRELLRAGMPVADIAKKVGCSTVLVYNVRARSGGGGAPKRGGRPAKTRKADATAGLDGIASILDAVKTSERERAQFRAALERIQTVLSEALS